MKRFYSILITLITTAPAYAQAVLNEIYAYPGAGNHEFFELYNTSTGNLPTTVDNYMLVTYFSDGKNSGFFVMDLPNMPINPKGHFVGSSAIPFNYQGNVNSYASDFSWNDASFRNGSTNGYLKMWVQGSKNMQDKNPFYDEVAVPADFNDFFFKMKGNGASFNTFLFKDGNLMNSFLGGTGGTAMIPAEIANMPVLVMESVTAASGSVYYGTNFTKYKAIEAENVIQDIGTDNGYMRTRDGMCGTWEKSSAQAFHTPKATNGSLSQMEIEGALTLDAHVSRGLTSEDSSFVSYRVVSGPADLFPAEVYAYVDNGSVNDEWDANDIFLKADTLTAANDSTFLTRFLPQDQEVIFVIKTLQGCYDQVRLVLNPEIPKTALPVQLKMFTGKENQGKSLLEWVVSGNESGVQFEVEKSVNGKDFSTAGLVRNTSRPGEEYYSFTELLNSNAFYRLRIMSKDNRVTYSPVIFVKDGAATTTQKLFIVQNPAVTSLVANYPAARAGTASIHIYNTLGVKVLSVEKALHKGPNTISISLDAKCTSGTYILELIHDSQRSVARFIKR